MKLFEPIRIGTMEVPNRIVFPPIGTDYGEEGGTVGDTTLNYYVRRAEGGAGLVVVEFAAVDEERYASPRQLRISNDSFIPGMHRLASSIKKAGARAAIQIHHPGRQGYSSVTGLQSIAPSAIPCPRVKEMPREMTVAEIEDLIEKFARAAVRAREAGFDAVQVHGAHGYLVCQFLSPFSNKRTDEYGGDTARRARFATEIIRRSKQLAGSDFPLILRISADEHVEGGLTVPEACEIARMAVAAGADAIDVSAGNYAAFEWTIQPQFFPRACLAPLSAAVKPAVSVPVVVAGRINDATLAERILQDGQADMVAIGRALLADPDLPRKAKAGSSRLHRCTACNTCTDHVLRLLPMRCPTNPELGVEGVVEDKAEAPRKVLVVGGGPSGLEAARIARLRGHEVTLWDQRAKPDGRWAYLVGGFVKDRLQRLRDLGVRVELGRAVSADAVAAAGADVALVVQALVARPAPFDVSGAPAVVTADEVLDDGAPCGKRVAIVGGDTAALEVAETLLKKGALVTLVDATGRLGGGIESVTRKVLVERLDRAGLSVVAPATVQRIDSAGLEVAVKEGTQTIAADTVVLALGYRRDEQLLADVKQAGIDARSLPACESPRSVCDTMAQGAEVARAI